jgi:hypothetical protein
MKKNITLRAVVVAALLSGFGIPCFASLLTDDADTLGLWHMDTLAGTLVEDDDSYSGGARGNDLTAYGTVTLASPGHDGTGGALDFAGGSGDKAGRNGVWPLGDIDGFVLDLWFNVDKVSGVQKIAYTHGFSIDLGNSGSATTRVGMTVYGGTGTWWYNSGWDKVTAGQWYHLQAGLDADSNPTLMLDGVEVGTVAGTPNAIRTSSNGWLTVGQSLDGRIDEVKISQIPEPATIGLMGCAGIGLFVARRRLMI